MKSTANLQLMFNSNRGRITYGLRIAGYFRMQRLKIAIFTHDIVIVAVAALRQVLAGPMPCHRKNRTWRWDLPVIFY